MRIISKFKDYYDIGMAYGQDPKLVYVRETKDIPQLKETERIYSKSYKDESVLSLNNYGFVRYGKDPFFFDIPMAYVIFCGKMYFGLYVKDKWHWTFESFDKAMLSIEDKNVINYYNEKTRYWSKFSTREEFERTYDSMKAKSEKYEKSWQKINIEHKSPIILIKSVQRYGRTCMSNTYFRKDVCLKDYNFAAAVDPYTAYQELSMFMSNFIGINENPMINISDSDRAAMHGYNEKSFRNPVKAKDL